MKGLLLKDWYVIFKQGKVMFLFVLLYLILGALEENTFFGAFAVLFLSLLPITVMGFDERSKWDRFAVTLPVTRKQLVLEKYLFSLIALGAGTALYLVFSIASSAFAHRTTDLAELLGVLAPMLSVSLIFSAVNFPMMFQLGVEKGRLWFILIIALLGAILGGLLAMRSNEGGSLPPWLNGQLLWLLLPVSLLLFAISYPLSVRIYEKREL